MFPFLALAGIGFCLLITACGDWNAAPAALTARTGPSPQGMACDACHAYPLTDRNHDYHLTTASANRLLNGRITCLDCHTRSIRSEMVIVIDTVFQDTDGSKYFSSQHPHSGDITPAGTPIRSLSLLRVDSLHQNHPIAQTERPGAHPLFEEYVTTLAHLNGTVDVAFDPRNSDPAQYGGDSASFNPESETCSAVACHPGGKDYRWAAPHKGLPALPEETP
ncbi:MAG: hypothetical protein JF616_14530 [Fibrobacteres bacterium]|nr:hypothetical protein [Fibrobacterota bacterium]